MPRLIILTGAPEEQHLDWSEHSLLPLGGHEAEERPDDRLWSSSPHDRFTAKWRQLASEPSPMKHTLPRLEIGQSSPDGFDHGPANFFSTHEILYQDSGQESADSDLSADESRPSQDSNEYDNEALSGFYDHSFSIHEAVPSSHLESGQPAYTPGTPTYESNDEMLPLTRSSSSGIIRTPSGRRLSQAPRPQHLSNLEDLPNASHLMRLHPQTMTVNLIVSILSISPSRTVMTGLRYNRPKEVDLVEMTVGDDTKAGFSISMWLPREMRVNWKDGAQEKPEGARSNLRRNLKTFRCRDIVLLQNVALSFYRGKVHGQSLRGDVTKADLLFRKKLDEDDFPGVYSVQNLRMATGKDAQIMKVKRVRDWMLEFVGDAIGGRPERSKRRRARFPDDSQ